MNFCTPEVKALAFISLVRPHLEYASASWDLFTARDTQQLEWVLRRGAFVHKDYQHTTSVSQLYCPTSAGQPCHLASKSPISSSFTRAYMASVPYRWIIYVAQLDLLGRRWLDFHPFTSTCWLLQIFLLPNDSYWLEHTAIHCPDLFHLSTPFATPSTEWCSPDTLPARRPSWLMTHWQQRVRTHCRTTAEELRYARYYYWLQLS